ncbi:MAG: hypothetical protein RBT36_09085 [Desulfobulbus sp.]|nr:hypothetical protein [Desulfobulbus sp.]
MSILKNIVNPQPSGNPDISQNQNACLSARHPAGSKCWRPMIGDPLQIRADEDKQGISVEMSAHFDGAQCLCLIDDGG